MRAALFDLDMTLVETRADIAASVNALREAWGLDVLDPYEISRAIGDGIPALLARVLGDAVRGREEEARRWFFEHYEAHCLDETHAYEGIPRSLDVLVARGVRLAVVSNKAETFCRKILDGLDLSRRVDVVVGGDTTSHRKPHPGPLAHAMTGLGVERAVMVGDTWRDVRAARALSVPVIAVTWGLDSEATLAREEPDEMIRRPSEFLPAILTQLER